MINNLLNNHRLDHRIVRRILFFPLIRLALYFWYNDRSRRTQKIEKRKLWRRWDADQIPFFFYDCHLSRSRARRLGPLHLDFTAFSLEMFGKQWEYRLARPFLLGEIVWVHRRLSGLVDFTCVRVLSPSFWREFSRRYDSRYCYLRAINWRDDWNLFLRLSTDTAVKRDVLRGLKGENRSESTKSCGNCFEKFI